MARSNKYVSKVDCQQAMAPLEGDIIQIKEALIGNDMRGGIVKDLGNLNSKVDNFIISYNKARIVSTTWKVAVFTAVVASILAIIDVAIRVGI